MVDKIACCEFRLFLDGMLVHDLVVGANSTLEATTRTCI